MGIPDHLRDYWPKRSYPHMDRARCLGNTRYLPLLSIMGVCKAVADCLIHHRLKGSLQAFQADDLGGGHTGVRAECTLCCPDIAAYRWRTTNKGSEQSLHLYKLGCHVER